MRVVALFHPRVNRDLVRRFGGAEIVDWVPDGAEAALIFGGDGTMHRHLPRLVETGTPALNVPAGSGNDFAHALGLKSIADAERAWRAFLEDSSRVKAIDVGEIVAEGEVRSHPVASDATRVGQPELFCCIAGVGLDSEVNRRANALPAWLRGRGGYVAALLPALAKFNPPRVSAEVVDANTSETITRISERAMLCAIANAQAYGDGMRIAPRAVLDDGQLDVCFVERVSKFKLLRLFPTVFSGRHLSIKEVRYVRATRLRLDSDRPLEIFADGEFIGTTPAEFRVRSKALRVIAAVGH